VIVCQADRERIEKHCSMSVYPLKDLILSPDVGRFELNGALQLVTRNVERFQVEKLFNLPANLHSSRDKGTPLILITENAQACHSGFRVQGLRSGFGIWDSVREHALVGNHAPAQLPCC
jgi:hypothetical protein